MSHRPSIVKSVVEIDIPRPRDTTTITLERFHQKEIDEIVNPAWEAWRAKYYVMSQEEQAKELGLSYPHLRKDT